ncbi:MAG: cbb3-type cytochrome c oxidase subunit II [Mariprofundaceae bacterium]
MAFREYKIGCYMFGIALSFSMFVTIFLPSINISEMSSTKVALEKQLTYGWETGFNYYDPFLQGKDKPIKVVLDRDPKTGQAIDETAAYVFKPGTHFPNGLTHENILGEKPRQASVKLGRIDQASEDKGGVFLVRETEDGTPYIEYATATRGWTVDATLNAAKQQLLAGSGKTMFVREGCWWCHTLLPEQTQDWQTFGRPPLVGDFNGESPTTFGSDRKAPDLLHVGARNSSREWMTLHFFNPRLVQPHSIMPRYDYLWGDKDAHGKPIDLAKWDREYFEWAEGKRAYPPEVPEPAPDSEARMLIDFILNLK